MCSRRVSCAACCCAGGDWPPGKRSSSEWVPAGSPGCWCAATTSIGSVTTWKLRCISGTTWPVVEKQGAHDRRHRANTGVGTRHRPYRSRRPRRCSKPERLRILCRDSGEGACVRERNQHGTRKRRQYRRRVDRNAVHHRADRGAAWCADIPGDNRTEVASSALCARRLLRDGESRHRPSALPRARSVGGLRGDVRRLPARSRQPLPPPHWTTCMSRSAT